MVNIQQICARYKWNKACCECIVKNESSGNGNSMNYNTNGTFDVGVFQINKINWAGCNGGNAPCDVEKNF